MMLKPFQTYIYELSKPSEFRIKLAGEKPSSETMAKIKNALETFQLESISAVKSLPIQEHREFPQWGSACECWQFDVKVTYPTTAVSVRQTIKERAHINPDWINVRNLHEAEYTDESEMRGKNNQGALLDKTQLEDEPNSQELVGQKRIGSFMKELHTREYEIAGNDKTDGKNVVTTGKTINDAPQGDTGPLSKQNTIYRKPRG